MKITEKIPEIFIVVILYDPVAIKKVSIDRIKSTTSFDFISCIGEDAIVLKAPQNNVDAFFRTTKLEYTDRNTSKFQIRDLKELRNLLKSLPDISMRAIGINLFMKIKIDSKKNVAMLIRDAFLKDTEKFQKKFGKTIIQNSTRIFYGSPEDHYDLRLTPISFSGPELGIQLHYHRDIYMRDMDKFIGTLEEFFKETQQELVKIINILRRIE